MPRVEELMAASAAPAREDITEAIKQACHGRPTLGGEYLVRHGADINGIPRVRPRRRRWTSPPAPTRAGKFFSPGYASGPPVPPT
jgi:hypothetical protein